MQSISGTNLGVTALSPTRRPTHKVVIDWARAGWGSEASWTDESSRVRSITITQQVANTRGGVAILGNAVAGTASLVLDNHDGRFSPHNTSSPLYSHIRDGKLLGVPVRIYLGFYNGETPERLVQFSGYIAEPRLVARGGQVTLSLEDRTWDLKHAFYSTTLYTPGTPSGYSGYPDDYIARLIALLPVEKRPNWDLDRGLYPLMFAWMDDESLWDELSRVALSQGGMIWFDKAGQLIFRDGSWFGLNETVAHTFDKALDAEEAWRETDIWNHVIVRYGGGRVARLNEIWSSNEPIMLRGGEERSIRARFRTPVYTIAVPTSSMDYEAVYFDGSRATAALHVGLTAYAQRGTLTVTNTGAKPMWITKLRLRGWPVDLQDQQEVEDEDATSIAQYGRRTLLVDQLYLQSERQARGVCKFLLARYKVPHATYRIMDWARPWLEVGDRVRVTLTRTGYDEDFFIVGLTTSYDVSRGYRHTYELLRVKDLLPYENWFIVGATALGPDHRWFF